MSADTIQEQADAAGYEAGTAAGSWVIDGNTTEDAARTILEGIADGDPEVMDALPSAPLSGEWAGAPLPRDILRDLDADEYDDDAADEILRAYEDGYSRGVVDEVQRSALATLDPREAAARSWLGEYYREPESYDEATFGDWLIVTDDEADDRARENIERDLWAFVPSFLVAYMPEGITEDVLETLAGARCEDATPAFRAMVGDRFDDLVSDAISSDGRGHFLSSWDGCEHEFEHNGTTWFGYRQ
jgi:hypothetical protein